MPLKITLRDIPDDKLEQVKDAILSYIPIPQIPDPNDEEQMIDAHTPKEWITMNIESYLFRLYNRGQDKLIREAGQKLNDIF